VTKNWARRAKRNQGGNVAQTSVCFTGFKEMQIGYARVSKADGSQTVDLQLDALIAAGIESQQIYTDHASGKKDDRPGLETCLKALRKGDTLVIWKLDRLGRNLTHLVNLIDELQKRHVALRVLTGQGANIDTTTSTGKLVFGIFAALAEYERSLIAERTRAGLIAARARGRRGGRRHTMTPGKVRLAMAAMGNEETVVNDLCRELEITRQTLYRYVSPKGQLRESGKKLLKAGKQGQIRR
jgi:DNA invertase Pin-like site-specific DNA recombinase